MIYYLSKIAKTCTNLFSRRIVVGIACSLVVPYSLVSQSFSSDFLRNNLRNHQLTGTYKTGFSYSVNSNQVSVNDIDSASGYTRISVKQMASNPAIRLRWMPLLVSQQYNSQLPYGWNDGSMIPARGYQSFISGGIYAKIGKHISIQIMPEWVYAANQPFEQFSEQLGTRAWADYYRFWNTSDIPEQFGTKPYSKLFAGQSSIKYNFRSFSAGISTENLWWGPGWKNALIMGTSAPGFLHLTFHTVRPVKTSIGNFEGQVIAGSLSSSGFLPPRIFSVDTRGEFVYQPKRNEKRYISGMVLIWQPKWVANLYLGIAKSSYLYPSDISNPLDVLPLQGFLGRTRTSAERTGKKASMGSLFARYVMPGDRAELYMELGRKDISMMPWNIIQIEDYRRAYVVGARKLFSVKKGAFIQVAAEFTQIQAPTAELIRDPDSWYTHRYVRHGYTHQGQVLGAGIGSGSNNQTIEISWVKGLKKIGMQFERIRYNSDFYYYAFEYLWDFRRHWVDISTTLHADWNMGKLVLSGKLSIIRSYNYKWLVVQVFPNDYFAAGNEFINLSGNLNLIYRL